MGMAWEVACDAFSTASFEIPGVQGGEVKTADDIISSFCNSI